VIGPTGMFVRFGLAAKRKVISQSSWPRTDRPAPGLRVTDSAKNSGHYQGYSDRLSSGSREHCLIAPNRGVPG